MRLLLSLFLSLSFASAFSQLGVNNRYQNLDDQPWEDILKVENLFENGYEIGLDYWFRLKEYRVEFMPELYFGNASTEFEELKLKYRNIGLAVNTNFYIFDFIGDCQCPTFSKQGNFLTKGFFLSVAPLIENQGKITRNIESRERGNESSFQFGATIGAGVDIGLTDLITITPYIRYKVVPNAEWEAISSLGSGNIGSSPYLQNHLMLGLRLGFRPDYVREQNKYRFRR
jgi:hypothetical protein